MKDIQSLKEKKKKTSEQNTANRVCSLFSTILFISWLGFFCVPLARYKKRLSRCVVFKWICAYIESCAIFRTNAKMMERKTDFANQQVELVRWTM